MVNSKANPGNADQPATKEGKMPNDMKGSRSIGDKGRLGERGDRGRALLVFVEWEAVGVSWGCRLGLLDGVPGRLLASSVSSAVMVLVCLRAGVRACVRACGSSVWLRKGGRACGSC